MKCPLAPKPGRALRQSRNLLCVQTTPRAHRTQDAQATHGMQRTQEGWVVWCSAGAVRCTSQKLSVRFMMLCVLSRPSSEIRYNILTLYLLFVSLPLFISSYLILSHLILSYLIYSFLENSTWSWSMRESSVCTNRKGSGAPRRREWHDMGCICFRMFPPPLFIFPSLLPLPLFTSPLTSLLFYLFISYRQWRPYLSHWPTMQAWMLWASWLNSKQNTVTLMYVLLSLFLFLLILFSFFPFSFLYCLANIVLGEKIWS